MENMKTQTIYSEIIRKLLDEVDLEIKEVMLKEGDDGYFGYDLLPDPTNTILRWQELRDRRK